MQKYKFVFGDNCPGICIAELHKKVGGEYVKKTNIFVQKKKDNSKELDKLLKKDSLSEKEKQKLRSILSSDKYSEFLNENMDEFVLPSKYAVFPIKREYPGSKRESCYITGISGSGKSKWIADYLDNYRKQNPKNDIVFFSDLASDQNFDRFKPINMDPEQLLLNPIDKLDELKDTACIFDDTNAIRNLQTNKMINGLRDSILETGRHHNITILCTSHMATDGDKTKYPIRESHIVVLFPRGNFQTERLLTTYCGIKKNALKKIQSIGSRWIMINKHTPSMVLHKRGGYLI